jgi:hypothetical protein
MPEEPESVRDMNAPEDELSPGGECVHVISNPGAWDIDSCVNGFRTPENGF